MRTNLTSAEIETREWTRQRIPSLRLLAVDYRSHISIIPCMSSAVDLTISLKFRWREGKEAARAPLALLYCFLLRSVCPHARSTAILRLATNYAVGPHFALLTAICLLTLVFLVSLSGRSSYSRPSTFTSTASMPTSLSAFLRASKQAAQHAIKSKGSLDGWTVAVGNEAGGSSSSGFTLKA